MRNSIASILMVSFLLSCATVFAFDSNKEKTLIIFSADWCKYCQLAKKDMQNDTKLAEEIKKFSIIDIDFDVDKDIVDGYNIKSIPAFVVFENGKEIKRKIGYKNSNDLLKFLD